MHEAVSVIDGFKGLEREEISREYGKYLDTIRMQMKYGPSREGVVDKLIRSIERTKCGSPEKSPLYMVCKWLETNPIVGFKDNNELRKAISKGTGLKQTTLQSIFRHQSFKLPPYLEYKKRPKKDSKLPSPPPVVVPKKESASPVEQHIGRVIREGEKAGVTLPPNLKELVMRGAGFELTLRF